MPHKLLYASCLLLLHATGVTAQNLYEIRLHAFSFDQMLFRESKNELSFLQLSHSDRLIQRRTLWRRISRRYFKRGRSCQGISNPCVMPFILCDSTSGMSGYDRQQRLTEILNDNVSPQDGEGIVKIAEIAFYNSYAKTCYIASMPPRIATSVAINSCEKNAKKCLIHPLTPMTKLYIDTVQTVKDIIELELSAFVVIAELSPYFKQQQRGANFLSQIAADIIDSGNEQCLFQFEDTLPTTSQRLGFNCDNALSRPQIQTEWVYDNDAAFQISLTPGESDEDEAKIEKIEMVLQFISGLAVRPEFSAIQVLDFEYYNDYYS